MGNGKNIVLKAVGCSRGAPLGRCNEELAGACRLQKVIMVGAYDGGGAYWGIGNPVYVAEDTGGRQAFVNASTRAAAKSLLLEAWGEDISFLR